jgi:anti-anti-sigma factor
VVLDLGHVPELDSSGIGQLVQVHNEVSRSGKGFMLVNVERHQQRLLEVVRLVDVLHVCESRQEALACCEHMVAPECGTSFRLLEVPA